MAGPATTGRSTPAPSSTSGEESSAASSLASGLSGRRAVAATAAAAEDGPQSNPGPEGWVSASTELPYTIRFENSADATAPAQVATVTLQLGPALDWRTFRLSEFRFLGLTIEVPDGRAFYSGRADLTQSHGFLVDYEGGIDVSTGLVTWTLRTIDPATGAVPTDPTLGFLPPSDRIHFGDHGQAHVSYTIRARSDVPSGTVIETQARVAFDTKEPVNTPLNVITLDAGAPTSSVAMLPATTMATEILVTWTGDDELGGSALADFDIFVSDDGGSFVPWITNTSLREATFVGQEAHTYAFYSVARDNTGNREAVPATPDTQITFAVPAPPTIAGSAVQAGLVQRSFVDRVQIDFTDQMNLADLIANGSITSALTLTNLGVNAEADADAPVALTANQFHYDYDAGSGLSRLTWSLDAFAGGNASLDDGFYSLALNSSLITSLVGIPLDANGDGTSGDDFLLSFHRLQGDADGSMLVDAADMAVVNGALGATPTSATWNANADLDRDGRVTVRDRLITARADGHAILPPTAPAPATAALPGDFNADNSVDAADLVVWEQNFGAVTVVGPLLGDTDGDQDVDGTDFLMWQRNFGRSIDDGAIDDGAPPTNNPTVTLAMDVSVEATAEPAVSIVSTISGEHSASYASDRGGEVSNILSAAARLAAPARDEVFSALAGTFRQGKKRLDHHLLSPQLAVSRDMRTWDQDVLWHRPQLKLALNHLLDDRRYSSSPCASDTRKHGPVTDCVDQALAEVDPLELALIDRDGPWTEWDR